MKTLLILRHAKSSRDDPNMADHDRPLNERGKRAAKEAGGSCAMKIWFLISSSAQRLFAPAKRLKRPPNGATIRVPSSLRNSFISAMGQHTTKLCGRSTRVADGCSWSGTIRESVNS